MEDELSKALDSVTNEPFNLSQHAAYIWLALQMENGREMVVEARSTQYQQPTAGHTFIRHVLESPQQSHSYLDVWLPLQRHKFPTLNLNTYYRKSRIVSGALAHIKSDYLCEFT